MQDNKPLAILVFELGHLQVFYYQTMEEWNSKAEIKAYFWHNLSQIPRISHGPFPSIFVAVDDYSRNLKPVEPLPQNVIAVDFKAKRKLVPPA